MTKFTDKQRSFIVSKAAGVANRDAAIAAGYAPTAADVTAAKLLRRADIKAAIKASPQTDGVANVATLLRSDYPDAMSVLMDVMNHSQFPIALRMDAAKNLLPYQHAKIGEQGKKEKAKERAAELGSSRSRFAQTPIPHSMRVIKGGKDG